MFNVVFIYSSNNCIIYVGKIIKLYMLKYGDYL